MRVLDEVAEAIRRARGRTSDPVLSAVELEGMFACPLTSGEWAAMQRYLSGALPELEFVQGHWFPPDGCATIWDLADHVAQHRPDWERPAARTEAAWREAQVFVGVRACLVDALSLDEKDVTRAARLKRDLGAE